MMTDDNKVKIKINIKNNDKKVNTTTEPVLVTEWHFKRIIMALLFVSFIIWLVFYLFVGDTVDLVESSKEKITESTDNKALTSVAEISHTPVLHTHEVNSVQSNNIDLTVVQPKQQKKGIKKTNAVEQIHSPKIETYDEHVVRALLAKDIKDKEPVELIDSTVNVSKKAAAGVYYYTEIINMKGKYLYHVWLWNDQLIFKRKINILGKRWRAATSKLITYSKRGAWTVRLLNPKGVVLNEINFQVVAE